jgi:hypothetical protein
MEGLFLQIMQGKHDITLSNCVCSSLIVLKPEINIMNSIYLTPFLFNLIQQRGGRRGGGGGVSRPAARAPARSPPAPVHASHPPATQSAGGGGMLSGIGSTIAQGMAFGTGSAIAHRAVGAVAGSFGGGGSEAPAQAAPEYAQGAMQSSDMPGGACASDKTMFYECLQQNKGDQQACAFLYDQLKQCQAGGAMNQTQFG